MGKINRHKYQCLSEGVPKGEDASGFDAVSAILWSDPLDAEEDGAPFRGCEPNENRGTGYYWGHDVSEAWLDKHNLALIIRSHECVEQGFDLKHNGRVITLFS